jgi:hypothetical protein
MAGSNPGHFVLILLLCNSASAEECSADLYARHAGLDRGIHAFGEDVDGGDEPGHDVLWTLIPSRSRA